MYIFQNKLLSFSMIVLLLLISVVAEAQTVSLSEKKSSLKSVLEKLRKQTGYDFLYTTPMLKEAQTVTIEVKNEPLEQVLRKIFENQPLQFSIEDRSVVITKKVVFSVADGNPGLLQGTVYTGDNIPLTGASVRIVGFSQSAATDENGAFVIRNAPLRGQLTVSFIGYKTDTVVIDNHSNIIVHLTQAVRKMEEVIIVSTGYQQLNKERATGSFGKPDMNIFTERSGTTDVISRLDGLVPGVSVVPGNKGLQPNRYGTGTNQQSVIRGQSTVRLGTQPLYVVNGVMLENVSTINTDDIEDISVLKDASAAAIWGARAANGVIVITTKKGKAGTGIRFNYTGYITWQGKPDFSYGRFMNSEQYIQAVKETFDPVTYPWSTLATSIIAPHDQILYDQYRGLITQGQANTALDSLSHIDNRQQVKDLWFRNALVTNHTISASGGGAVYNFYSSLSYTNNHSNDPGASNNVYRLALNQTITPTKSIRLTLNTLLNNTTAKTVHNIGISAGFLPYQLFEDANGNHLKLNYVQGLSAATRADYQQRSRINLDYSPLDEVNLGYFKSNLLTINTTADLSVKFTKGLSFNGTYGYQKSPGGTQQYDDITLYSMRRELLNYTVARTPAATPVYYLPTTGGKYTKSVNDSYNWTVRNQLIYNTRVRNNKDQLNVQVGQEVQEQYRSLSATILRGYDDRLKTYSLIDYNTLSQGVFGAVGSFRSVFTEQPYTITYDRLRFRSYFGLLSYGINDKYFLDGSIRRDYSNLFSSTSSSQKKPAYSFGGKWLLSRETFINLPKWVNNLGIRATYGITGNSPDVLAGSVFDILQTQLNTTYGNSLYVTSPQNNKLTWESTHTFNAGVDFSVLSNRISGSLDFYSKNTTDLLGQVLLNPLTGFAGANGNIGNVTNRGLEMNLKTINVQSGEFYWATNFVFSYNHNKLASYTSLLPEMLTANYRLTAAAVAGYTSPALFAYRYAGLDNLGDPQIKLANGTVTKQRDAATANDLVYMGSTLPVFNGGLSNTFRYSNLSLTANIVYNLGAVMRRDVNFFYKGRLSESVGGFGGNVNEDFASRWKKPGDEAFTNIPSYVASSGLDYNRRNTDYYTQADINVVSASYFKIRDLTLGYDFSRKLLKSIKVETARIYAQTGNILLWKANKYGIDPEYQLFTTGTRAIPAYFHPITLGLNLTF